MRSPLTAPRGWASPHAKSTRIIAAAPRLTTRHPAAVNWQTDVIRSRDVPGSPRSDRGESSAARVQHAVATEADAGTEAVGLQASDRARVEALLLLSKSPLSLRRIATMAGLEDATRARTLVAELNAIYDRLGRGMRVESVAGGMRLMTRPVVAPWLSRLGFLPSAIRLSWPMMETLAVVAYRQEVTRADVEATRGVACGEILRQLMQMDLVRITGRGDELGRPYLYGTTKRFLKIYGLPSIKALPPIDAHPIAEDVSDSQLDLPTPTPDPKEPDVTVTLTDPQAIDSSATDLLSRPNATQADFVAVDQTVAVIEDEEDDLYEKGFESDDDEDDDFDDDWDDEDDDEADDDVDDSDDDDSDDDDSQWEEVDDDDADEEWDDDEEDDDWDDESADDDEDWDDDEDE